MGIGKGLVLAVAAAVLGAAVVILPAAASSETPPAVTAENVAGYYHYWTPSAVTVAEGGAISLSNPTAVAHGVEWRSGPEQPVCTAGIPVGTTPGAAGKEWNGTCTFKKSGTYVFWCTVHREAMKETVTVTPASTTTGTTGTMPGGTTGTIPGGGGGGGTNGSPPVPSSASTPTPLAAAAVTAVKIGSQQRGRAVRGSLKVSSAGAGGRLEVDLLAKRASLASARSSFLRVGRIVRSTVGPGFHAFRVPLSANGRRALARAGRLVLVVQVTLAPGAGSATVVRRTVTLRG